MLLNTHISVIDVENHENKLRHVMDRANYDNSASEKFIKLHIVWERIFHSYFA